MAMVEALADGLIDVVGSFHTPQDEEEKRLPFEEAAERRGRAGDAAAGGDAALPCRASDACRRSGGRWRSTRRGCSGWRRGGWRRARRRTWCSSTPTRPSCSTAPRCARSRRTRPTTCAGCRGGCCGTWVGGREVFARDGDMTLALTCALGLPARLDPVRGADHPRARARRPARHRLGQHRRDQRAPDRQQGRGRGHAGARRRQGRGGGAGRARARRRGRGDARGARGVSRPPLPGLAGLPGRQGRRDLPRRDLLALAWPVGLAACATWLATAAPSRISSLAALVAAASTPLWLALSARGRRSGWRWRWRRSSSCATAPTSAGCSTATSRGSGNVS